MRVESVTANVGEDDEGRPVATISMFVDGREVTVSAWQSTVFDDMISVQIDGDFGETVDRPGLRVHVNDGSIFDSGVASLAEAEGEIRGLHPVAEGEIPARSGFRVRDTGEVRPPRAGEWFLSGAIVEGYRARNDQQKPERIGELIEGRTVFD